MPDPDTHPHRYPKASYKGTNGFVDPVRLRFDGTISTPNLHISASSCPDPQSADAHAKKVRDAVERRRFAEDVLQLKGAYFPGLAAAKEIEQQPETPATVKRNISELQRRHRDEMQKLYTMQAEDYLEGVRTRYFSKDDSIADPQIDAFYQASREQHHPDFSAADDAASAYRHAYLNTLLPLLRQRASLMDREDAERRRRDARFPPSITEYRAIRNKDVQVRIARFLTADTTVRDRMMSSFGWAWRQVQGVVNEYEKNLEFKAEIQDLVREVEARDPRRKPSLANAT
ncbi:hypothetical protein AcW1_006915 [Taiwanofungus camphoratus]|nr:hypothetical protein AcV5_002727 [Antrodia cinnamomea]KAI0946981.1 hypothetical protein AcV7_009543 [Antrodia cinnamomea]KAI0955292.1 hypothetical protein AcW1_006915 [Antrodia cinnamomea]